MIQTVSNIGLTNIFVRYIDLLKQIPQTSKHNQ